MTQSSVLVVWTLVTRHPHRWHLLTLIAAAHAASLLEVFDFPPLGGVLDAHSLWHTATPAIALGWWSFLEADMAAFWPADGKRA